MIKCSNIDNYNSREVKVTFHQRSKEDLDDLYDIFVKCEINKIPIDLLRSSVKYKYEVDEVNKYCNFIIKPEYYRDLKFWNIFTEVNHVSFNRLKEKNPCITDIKKPDDDEFRLKDLNADNIKTVEQMIDHPRQFTIDGLTCLNLLKFYYYKDKDGLDAYMLTRDINKEIDNFIYDYEIFWLLENDKIRDYYLSLNTWDFRKKVTIIKEIQKNTQKRELDNYIINLLNKHEYSKAKKSMKHISIENLDYSYVMSNMKFFNLQSLSVWETLIDNNYYHRSAKEFKALVGNVKTKYVKYILSNHWKANFLQHYS